MKTIEIYLFQDRYFKNVLIQVIFPELLCRLRTSSLSSDFKDIFHLTTFLSRSFLQSSFVMASIAADKISFPS